MNAIPPVLCGYLFHFFAGASLAAQCAQWDAAAAYPGVLGEVWAITNWDPDGVGPLGPRVVFGGSFTFAGNSAVQNVAAYDPATGNWSPLGTGLQGVVKGLAVLPGGELIAAGALWSSNGVANVARWDGTVWQPLGAGVDGEVWAAVVRPNGELVVGGLFSQAGGAPANRVARWNGSGWLPLGSGVAAGFVLSLAAAPNGDVLVGGNFTSAGGGAAGRIARWDGSVWSDLGGGFVGGDVRAIRVQANGDLVAGGSMWTASNIGSVVRWNGTAWSAIGSPPGLVLSLAVLPNGDFAVGRATGPVERWNGTGWSTLAGPGPVVRALQVSPSGILYAGGTFSSVGGQTMQNVAAWSGSTWNALPANVGAFSGTVRGLAEASNGDLVAVGAFTTIGSATVNGVARWNGTAWSPLGAGASQPVWSIAALPNDSFVVAGSFGAESVARWTAGAWVPMPGAPSAVRVAAGANGDIVAVGAFGEIVRWNGATWTQLGAFNPPSVVSDIAVLPGGQILVAGSFPALFSAANLALWDGSAWGALGNSAVDGQVRDVYVAANGDVVVAGDFTTPGNGLARWNGSAWATFGLPAGARVDAVGAMPDGDLVIARRDVGIVQRRQGAAWTTIGVVASGGSIPGVRCLLATSGGDLALGGDFSTIDGSASPFFARYESTCRATASTVGAGCAGSGGNVTLTPVRLPWLGSSYRGSVAGIAPNSLVVSAFGLTFSSLPLASIFPVAGASCLLLVAPTLTEATIATGSTASLELTIPDQAALIGLPIAHQAVLLEFSPLGALVGVSSSNAIALQLGDF